jgi:hypothetical protein
VVAKPEVGYTAPPITVSHDTNKYLKNNTNNREYNEKIL